MTYKEYKEYFVAFQENLNASKYNVNVFVFSEVMDQMFLTVQGAVQAVLSGLRLV